ncbi:hypothetical protein SAMN05421642_104166 [Rhodococcoides kyotonense]|uniref:Uncharacterized protein n=1 Tax=Rhodococcoides kyotonense TaxID=398843 RepID=A0A239GCA2_9NOCA|nr:hypothetical protein SAMN05421642_104166 [Rhodococcus kyotonensis]
MQLLSRAKTLVAGLGSAILTGMTTYGEYHLGSS